MPLQTSWGLAVPATEWLGDFEKYFELAQLVGQEVRRRTLLDSGALATELDAAQGLCI